jgi:uncharacterized protein
MESPVSMSTKVYVSENIGSVSGEFVVPRNARAMIVLAHGAGAGMNHVFMSSLSTALSNHGLATFRYNFPFIEKGSKRPDFPAVAHKVVEAAVKHSQQNYPQLPIFCAGKSFGGRMTSQYFANVPGSGIKGIIFYGFPLHPMGSPSVDRADHLQIVKYPMLFLQGTRDTLADLNLIKTVVSALPSATIKIIEGADHAFKVSKRDVYSELAVATDQWIHSIQL